MSEKRICTIEELQEHLKNSVSQKRYEHSVGVAKTLEFLLEKYPKEDYPKTWNGFSAGSFCGLAHDLGREYSDSDILEFCNRKNIVLSEEEKRSPVLAHGFVSAALVEELCPGYPLSWKRAIESHTDGDIGLDSLGYGLFVADYIEPGRVFMTEERRQKYLSSSSLGGAALLVLKDMMAHWKEKGYNEVSSKALGMKKELEEKI
ncbi:MAG: hypothetical protein HUK24_02175 [Sphaerochaetaceae bacterium]|nr:hypothetical protein [Sphaerochaetaceae bacterium]